MGTGKLLGRPDDMLWGNPGRNSFPRRGKGGGGLVTWREFRLYLKAFDENDSIVELIFTMHIHYPGHAERFREEHVNQETLEVKQPYLTQNLITRQKQIDFLQLT